MVNYMTNPSYLFLRCIFISNFRLPNKVQKLKFIKSKGKKSVFNFDVFKLVKFHPFELYDIKKKEIIIDSKMKEIRNECTLFVMNNSVLYAFCGISPEGSFLTTVEKCNLRQKDRSWSYVNYSTADNTLFEECYYIGQFFSDNSSRVRRCRWRGHA